ncbi:MAG: hypothetical protein KDK72_10625 [Chlamydiia bacterium]|nr:hypothetical protein [Chlamydiia bacterium]
MELSLFLAKVFGLYLVIVGFAYLSRGEALRQMVVEFYDSTALIFMGAAINLILGLLVVISHNVWVMGWPVIITILGYLMLLKGILNMFIPSWAAWKAQKFCEGKGLVYTGIGVIILGGYLVYVGFFVQG